MSSSNRLRIDPDWEGKPILSKSFLKEREKKTVKINAAYKLSLQKEPERRKKLVEIKRVARSEKIKFRREQKIRLAKQKIVEEKAVEVVA